MGLQVFDLEPKGEGLVGEGHRQPCGLELKDTKLAENKQWP